MLLLVCRKQKVVIHLLNSYVVLTFCIPRNRLPYPYLAQPFGILGLQCSSTLYLLVWLYNYFDMSVTDESYVDETHVWHIKL